MAFVEMDFLSCKPFFIEPLIPQLTSDIGSNGTAIKSSDLGNYAYYAFNGNYDNYTGYTGENKVNGYVEYDFNDYVTVYKYSAYVKNYNKKEWTLAVQFYNETSESWENLATFTTNLVADSVKNIEDYVTPTKAKKFRLIHLSPTKTSGYNLYIYNFNVLGITS